MMSWPSAEPHMLLSFANGSLDQVMYYVDMSVRNHTNLQC